MENNCETISDYLELEAYNYQGYLEFKFNGKLFDAAVVKVDGKDVLKIKYTPSDAPHDSAFISWMFKNYKRFKELVVDLSQPGWKIKKQIYEWLTNETFD